MRISYKQVVPAVVAALMLAQAGVSSQAGATAVARDEITGVKPTWAVAAADVGTVAAASRIQVRLYLSGADPAGLNDYARAVSTPGNPLYQHYLTPAQARRRFGATGAQVGALTSWLRSAGLTVSGETPHYVEASGPVSAVDTAFAVRLERYRVGQHTYRAPASEPSLPARLAPSVTAITGLDDGPDGAAPEATPGSDAQQCSRYYGQRPATGLPPAHGGTPPWAVCGYTAADLRGAYGVTAGPAAGRGVTVAIALTGAIPDMAATADRAATAQGEPAFHPGQYREVLLCQQDSTCTSAAAQTAAREEVLDVEAVHALAPGANVVYVGASTSTDGLLDALSYIVDHHAADIVSDSWVLKALEPAQPASVIAAYERIFMLGAVEGIGFYFGAGDDGDWALPGSLPGMDGTPHLSYPAADPWVTAVGGTSLAVLPGKRYAWEIPWGDHISPLSADGTGWMALPGSFAGGGGGGVSDVFAQPWYQHGVVPASLSTSKGTGPRRVIPDIAADASPYTGFRIGYYSPAGAGTSGTWQTSTVGGTSLACPIIAALQADAQQAAGGRPIGFANPAIYLRAGRGLYHDVTALPPGQSTPADEAVPVYKKGSGTAAPGPGLITLGDDSSLRAAPGFDDATGVGSPTGRYQRSFRPAAGGNR